MDCLNCGDKIVGNPRKKYCHQEKTKTCPTCGKDFSYICDKHAKSFCSVKCASQYPERQKKIRETTLKNHGVTSIFKKPEIREKAITHSKTEEAKRKREATNIQKFGVTNPMKDSEIAKKVVVSQNERFGSLAFNTEKQRETMMEKYGVEKPVQNPEILQKMIRTQKERFNGDFAFNTGQQRETMVKKYGGAGRLSSPEELDRQFKTMFERYGVKTPCENNTFKKKALDTIIKNNGHLFGNAIISKTNKDFAEKLNALGIETIFEKEIDGNFFDIFLPEKNILIDINPTITHNSNIPFACIRNGCGKNCEKHKAINPNYHFNRALLALEHNMTLVQKYDWDDEDDIVSFIYEKLRKDIRKYSARKLSVQKISQKDANSFFKKYHIQGGAKKQEYCYGLFDNDEMLAASSFVKSRFNSNYDWEFCRYAVKNAVLVHGGANKMFKEFIQEAQPKNVVSYVDLNHTTKQEVFLNSLNFEEISKTGATVVWDKLHGSSKKISQNSLNSLGADRLLGTSYGSFQDCGLNNEDIMLLEGFVKVHTAGNRVFLWNSSTTEL